MIYITRPVIQTHKTVSKTNEKSLDADHRGKGFAHIEKGDEKDTESIFKKEDLQNAIYQTNSILFGDNGKLEFKIHEDTGRMIVKLIDKETKEVIKEVPPEKILDLVARIWDLVGILVDERG